ncbi:calmodulin-binding protein [Lignipirellula cremea]|uniref:Calmodulin-binding protein n=1 Tax=Lignipirellula cremea TaxID=2528010 RepID=A0A518DMZ8_9BACT|nr:calmodulin-binding protein [Lignipirellula cremea]QDU93217.1 hypothetical protein Pla8534_09960 [Lignipirellula cremea]
MIRRLLLTMFAAVLLGGYFTAEEAQAQQAGAFGRAWGGDYRTTDWDRFYHYPFIYYPQNFWGNEYYRSSEDLYHRYPAEMRVPVYNKKWHNYYPEGRRYHYGNHFKLDVF